MRIAILSDTHGRQKTVQSVLQRIAAEQVELIVHCGDIDDAETVSLFPANTHFVYGNCDTDVLGIRRAIAKIGATLHEGFGHLELAGTQIAFTHGDNQTTMRELENADAYDFIFHGHTHKATEYRVGRTRVINPGALHRAEPKSFIFLNLPEGTLQRIDLP